MIVGYQVGLPVEEGWEGITEVMAVMASVRILFSLPDPWDWNIYLYIIHLP